MTSESLFPCRLLIDPPQSGAWNMAVDEALLCNVAESGIATFRLYEWNEPTLSLGYFQKYADRLLHPTSAGATVVRRQTGGGAILHDRELTYSLTLPRSHPLAADPPGLYKVVHNVIADVLRNNMPRPFGPALRYAKQRFAEPESFLCFQRRSAGDIILSEGREESLAVDHKIVGSAQRRSRAALLQHGSILLDRSGYAPELAGLNDVCDTKWTATLLAKELSVRLTQAFNFQVRERVLGDSSHAIAAALQDQKYGNRLWTERR